MPHLLSDRSDLLKGPIAQQILQILDRIDGRPLRWGRDMKVRTTARPPLAQRDTTLHGAISWVRFGNFNTDLSIDCSFRDNPPWRKSRSTALVACRCVHGVL